MLDDPDSGMLRQRHLSDFDVEIIDNKVVVVTDLDIGNRSVTNDIDNIVPYLRNTVPEFEACVLIYRDSDGVYDLVEHIDRESPNIRSLGAVVKAGVGITDRDRAIKIATDIANGLTVVPILDAP